MYRVTIIWKYIHITVFCGIRFNLSPHYTSDVTTPSIINISFQVDLFILGNTINIPETQYLNLQIHRLWDLIANVASVVICVMRGGAIVHADAIEQLLIWVARGATSDHCTCAGQTLWVTSCAHISHTVTVIPIWTLLDTDVLSLQEILIGNWVWCYIWCIGWASAIAFTIIKEVTRICAYFTIWACCAIANRARCITPYCT